MNIIVDLKTESGVLFTGYFTKPCDNIWFVCRVKEDDYSKFRLDENEFSLYGSIADTSICINTATIANIAYSSDATYLSVDVLPYEIAIGVSCENKEIIVKRYVTVFPELDWFFNYKIGYPVRCENEKFSFELNQFNTSTQYCNKEFSILHTINICYSKKGLMVTNNNLVEFQFFEPVPIMKAIEEISCARYLFCFLADDYVQLPSLGKFSVHECKIIEEEKDSIIDKEFWLNDRHEKSLKKGEYPFRILFGAIQDQFQDVWYKWIDFWGDVKNRPIIELFIEIVSNKSVGLNRFLNLCQALEVYSTQFRNKEVNRAWTSYIDSLKSQGRKRIPKSITLNFRLRELFIYHRDVMPNTDEEIIKKSDIIANIRNYYTHYNPKVQRKLEEEYGDIKTIDSRYVGTLHYLLLATVYKRVGIPIDIIKKALCYGNDTRFGRPLEWLYNGPNCNESTHRF